VIGTIVILLAVVTLLSFLAAQGTAVALNVARTARMAAENTAAHLEQANTALELRVNERTAALHESLRTVEQREAQMALVVAKNEQQRTTIHEMSLPVIPVNATTLVLPLIGELDSARLLLLQEQTLHAIERTSARTIVLDITGVLFVDTQVAQGLFMIVRSARLLGTTVILVGIRPEVAQTIVTLGITLDDIQVFQDLQSALVRGSTRAGAPPVGLPSRH
jgi:rsbT co-antagonist protein RsbR